MSALGPWLMSTLSRMLAIPVNVFSLVHCSTVTLGIRLLSAVLSRWAVDIHHRRPNVGYNMDDKNHERVDMDRGRHFREHLNLVERLAEVLFQQYLYEGPVDLLSAVVVLCRFNLELSVISAATRISSAKIKLALALCAKYELDNDFGALEESIRLHTQAQTSQSVCLRDQSASQTGLALSLYYRYQALDHKVDFDLAMRLIERARSSRTISDNSGLVQLLLVHATWLPNIVENLRVSSESMICMLQELRSANARPLSRYDYLCSLVAEMRLLVELASSNDMKDYALEGLRVLKRAVQKCSPAAEVLHYWIMVQEWVLHITMVDLHCEHPMRRIKEATHVAVRMKTSDLAGRNSLINWNAHFYGNLVAHQRAMRAESLDLHDICVNNFRTAALTSPGWRNKKWAINQLAYALGLYFDRSGRIKCLDEIIAICDMGTEYTSDIPYLSSNIAEAMLLRARTSDKRSAKVLVDKALHLCWTRQHALTSAEASNLEDAQLNQQIITASRMLLRMDSTLILSPENVIILARIGLEFTHQASTRASLLLAQIDCLLHLTRTRGSESFLSEAEILLEHELSMDSMLSTVYAIELIATQADISVTRWDTLSGEESLLLEAWALYHLSISHLPSAGHAKGRFEVCLRWASNAVDREHFSVALQAYRCAIELLPRVIFLGEDVVGRIEALRQVNGLASASVTVALIMDDVDAAVQFMESTRGILWLQSSQTHGHHTLSLPAEIKERFLIASSELEQTEDNSWTAKRHAAENLETIISEIRMVPTFERFLLPPLLPDLISALQATGGTVVVLNANRNSCDIIILGLAQGHSVLRLSAMNGARVRQLAITFATTCSGARSSQQEILRGIKKVNAPTRSSEDSEYLDLLASLWHLVTPIFQHMGLLEQAPGRRKRPRVWWCPIGALSSLPLHAAGLYKDGVCEQEVANYVVSSYVPTLSALHRILTESAEFPTSHARANVLLVAQSDASDLPSLPYTQLEVDRIRGIIPRDCILNLVEPQAMTVDEVLATASNASALHFACHAHQDQVNPLDSGFSLKDGCLTLAKLMRVKATQAQLAYLSACESAGVDEDRPDEGLNLASTMISLGFKSVIATLWAMDDIDGPFMADYIYRRIFRNGRVDMTAVPFAVDDAVRELRESGVPASRWATYVHFGV